MGNEEELRQDVRDVLAKSISEDALRYLLPAIEHDVVDNVMDCSAYDATGEYNSDDIKMAIGRVLMDKMGIMY